MRMNNRRGARLALGAVLGLMLALTCTTASYAEGVWAKILVVKGDVQVKDAGAAEWSAGTVGMALNSSAEITTGSDSSVLLGVGDGLNSAVKLDADRKAVLSSLDPVKINLESGKMYNLVRGLGEGSTFQVMTGAVVASARGTGWSQTSQEISVFEGTVTVESGGAQVDVSSGMSLAISGDGSLGEQTQASGESSDAFSEFEGEVEDTQSPTGSNVPSGAEESGSAPDLPQSSA